MQYGDWGGFGCIGAVEGQGKGRASRHVDRGLHLGTVEAALTLNLLGSGLGWEALGLVLFAVL